MLHVAPLGGRPERGRAAATPTESDGRAEGSWLSAEQEGEEAAHLRRAPSRVPHECCCSGGCRAFMRREHISQIRQWCIHDGALARMSVSGEKSFRPPWPSLMFWQFRRKSDRHCVNVSSHAFSAQEGAAEVPQASKMCALKHVGSGSYRISRTLSFLGPNLDPRSATSSTRIGGTPQSRRRLGARQTAARGDKPVGATERPCLRLSALRGVHCQWHPRRAEVALARAFRGSSLLEWT